MAATDLPPGVDPLGFLQGIKGDRGETGTFASVSLAMLPAGAEPVATITGPESARHLHLDVPRGLPGVSATPADEFIATVIAATDTQTRAALNALLAGKADASALAGKANAQHSHAAADLPQATTSGAGVVPLATLAQLQQGTADDRALSGKSLAEWEAWRRPVRNRAVFIGNSNATATRPSATTAWPVLLCAAMGWTQHNFAMDSQSLTTSGTPYLTLAQNGIGGMSTEERQETGIAFIADLSSDARAGVGYAAAYAAMKTLLAYVRAQLPNARIVVLPHIWPADSQVYTPGTWNAAIPAAVLATAKAAQDALSDYRHALFIDQSWTWLTGRDDLMIGAGDVHPNAAGHALIARWVERALDGDFYVSRQLWTPVPLAAGFGPSVSYPASSEFLARARPLSLSRVGWDFTIDGFVQRVGSPTSGPYFDVTGPTTEGSPTGIPRPFRPAYAVHADGHKMLATGGIGAGVPIELWANGYLRCYGALAAGEGVLIHEEYQSG